MTSVESKAETWKGTEELAQQGVAESTVELLELLSHVQGGRMDEQRCLFDPKKIPCTPKHTDTTKPAAGSVARPQAVSRGDRGGQGLTTAENETDRLCNMVSRVQGSRMDEQRCSAPQIFLAPGSPPAPRKAHSRPASPTATPSSQRPPGSASLSPTPDKKRVKRDGLHTAQQGVASGTVEQEQFFSMLSHVQRGRMEEQRCVFDPNKRGACTPKHPNTTKSVPAQSSMADIDQLFSILASTQSHRLDDQRVSLNLLPGLQGVSGSDQEGRGKSVAGKETDELCNMVSRLQGSRMDEQRCSAPQIFLAPGSPPAPRKAHSRPASPTATPSSQRPPGSASLSPTPDKERVQRDGLHTAQGVDPGTVEQEQFFSMLSHVQRGRMEEQRCVFDPNKRSACTPKHPNTAKSVPTQSSMADIDQLFSILASTQSHRLDDQRVSLNLLPGLQGVSGSDQEGRGKSVAGKETDELCNMVSRLQGSRMDEQRCSAPQIFLAPGSPPAPRKAHSRPASPTATPSSQRPHGSASLSPTPDKERVKRDGLHTAQQGVAPGMVEQEQFFSMLSHVQRGRMEEQRCVFDPNKRSACTPKHPNTTKSVPTQSSMADIDQLFSILASTQSHRLDDQRVSLNLLPGLQGVSGSDQEGRGKSVAGKETDELCNMVSRLQGCRIEEQRCSLPVAPSPGPPRSASMSAVTLESTLHRQDRLLSAPNPAPARSNPSSPSRATPRKSRSRPNSPSRATPRKSRSRPNSPSRATPRKSRSRPNSPSRATPRKSRSRPNSPSRATPRKSRSRPNSPSQATPRKSRSRPNSPSQATPRKSQSRPNSPSRATPRKSRSRPPSPNAAQHASIPISPDDDCFSLIHRVHAAQLHRGGGDAGAHGREGGKPERGGEKRAGGEGGKREGKTAGVVQKERRGKEEVRKEKKGGGKSK